jgi:hypothetical protein
MKKDVKESFRIGPIKGHEPSQEEETELSPVVIDLGIHRSGNLDESFLRMFGGAVKMALRRIFGDSTVPILIKGSRSEIDSFAEALKSEKKYLETMSEYGLDDPRTHSDKTRLKTAVAKFERKTNLVWPFK